MYSKTKNVQYLIALMKAHNVRHVVLSPGGRNIPINHCLEQDEFFTCYLSRQAIIPRVLQRHFISECRFL